jgi:hypothetical protein
MTASQLRRIAEANADAATYYARTNPALARIFSQAAKSAAVLAEQTARAEQLTTLRAELAEIKTVMT